MRAPDPDPSSRPAAPRTPRVPAAGAPGRAEPPARAGAAGEAAAELALRSSRFRREREADWRRLEAIVARVEAAGPRSLGFEDARDLALLYRQAVTSLSVAREISLDRGLLVYLEALCARAYLAVYAPQETAAGVLGRFLRHGAPNAMRRSLGALALAFLALALGGAIGALLFFEDSSWYNTFMPPSLAGGRGPASTRDELLDVIYGDHSDVGGLAAFAAYLFSHNTQVALFAFTLGVVACAPSFALAFYNGLILGVFVALHVSAGIGMDVFGWISVHGVTELGAIIVATAGGFRMGLAVLFPGSARRLDALRAAGRDAVKLAIQIGRAHV